jgi:hypothetical protein
MFLAIQLGGRSAVAGSGKPTRTSPDCTSIAEFSGFHALILALLCVGNARAAMVCAAHQHLTLKTQIQKRGHRRNRDARQVCPRCRPWRHPQRRAASRPERASRSGAAYGPSSPLGRARRMLATRNCSATSQRRQRYRRHALKDAGMLVLGFSAASAAESGGCGADQK